MVIRYSLYRVNTVAWLKVSNRSLFFLRRLLSQKGARVTPKYISFPNLFCPFNNGLDRCASDEVNEDTCLEKVQELQECDKDECHCGPTKGRRKVPAYSNHLPSFTLRCPVTSQSLPWGYGKSDKCNRRFKFLAWLLSFFKKIPRFVLHAVSVVWLSAPLRRMIIYVCILWNTWPP